MMAHRQIRPPDARIIKALYALGLGRLIGRMILLLTTTGRKSGLQRVTPLQYEEIDGAWYVASAKGTKADWFQNILANRHVQVRVKARHVHGSAEPITDPTRIADFLSLRLQRHPTHGLTGNGRSGAFGEARRRSKNGWKTSVRALRLTS